jgi:hypothetical protein
MVGTAEDRLSLLEHRVEELSRSLAALQQSLGAAAPPLEVAPQAPLPAAAQEAEPALAEASPLPGGFALVGRTLVALGGAYLLRALTAAGLLPDRAGVLLAFLYALVWLWLADRDGARKRAASADFHGGTAILIGLPLLWEATTRFHDLTPLLAGVALALFSATVFTVAWRRQLAGLAWLGGLGAVATAFLLIIGTRVWAPFTGDLVLLGLAGIWMAYGRGWRGLGGCLAAASSGGVLLTILVSHLAPDQAAVPHSVALLAGLILCLTWLASFAVRLLVQRREVSAFEAVLSTVAFFAGYAGAGLVAGEGTAAARWLGALGCALALACYTAAFGLVPRQERRKLLLTSSLAAAFLFAGSRLLLPTPYLAPLWAGLAIAAVLGSLALTRVTLALHGTFYSLAAAFASGLLAFAGYAFAAPAGSAWPPLTAPALLALASATVACLLPVPRPAPFWKPYASATRLLQLLTFTVSSGAALLFVLVPLVAGRPPAADAGLLATTRTVVLVAAALLLGWAGRWARFREASWLVYPLLVLASLKLVIEDFPNGRPATLFMALALCGGAFIVAPRVMRRAT